MDSSGSGYRNWPILAFPTENVEYQKILFTVVRTQASLRGSMLR